MEEQSLLTELVVQVAYRKPSWLTQVNNGNKVKYGTEKRYHMQKYSFFVVGPPETPSSYIPPQSSVFTVIGVGVSLAVVRAIVDAEVEFLAGMGNTGTMIGSFVVGLAGGPPSSGGGGIKGGRIGTKGGRGIIGGGGRTGSGTTEGKPESGEGEESVVGVGGLLRTGQTSSLCTLCLSMNCSRLPNTKGTTGGSSALRIISILSHKYTRILSSGNSLGV